ncbi:cupin domain-containing protein [Methylocystis sp. L43]|nr:cupin domain-containing protein [Methylocystis sp. L43]MBG0805828.1 cupin domain-containing protein [Methylocystis sp. H15]
MRILASAMILLAIAGSVYAQGDQKIDRMTVDAAETFTKDRLPWTDEPILPKGAKSVLLVGDPSKAGVFIAYLKFPPNYKIPPHSHPFAEVITILSGKLGNGMGEKFDAQKGGVLNAGSSFALPAGHAHFVWTTDEETLVELIATGPWGIAYTEPKEDPRKENK